MGQDGVEISFDVGQYMCKRYRYILIVKLEKVIKAIEFRTVSYLAKQEPLGFIAPPPK